MKKLGIYLLTQTQATGYDTYDSMVVIAASEEEARMIHPYSKKGDVFDSSQSTFDRCDAWAHSPEDVTAEKIGEALPSQEKGVILASFNAG